MFERIKTGQIGLLVAANILSVSKIAISRAKNNSKCS